MNHYAKQSSAFWKDLLVEIIFFYTEIEFRQYISHVIPHFIIVQNKVSSIVSPFSFLKKKIILYLLVLRFNTASEAKSSIFFRKILYFENVTRDFFYEATWRII